MTQKETDRMKLGINIEDVQKKNRCIVLQTLMEHSEISRVDLVRITNLNKATITNIIQKCGKYYFQQRSQGIRYQPLYGRYGFYCPMYQEKPFPDGGMQY